LPSLLQMPFLVILYSLIRGLSFGKLNKAGQVIKATPRYIPVHSKMYASLVASKGQMHSIFGMDLSSDPFSHHGSDQGLLIIPYLALIAIAVFLQYFQMKQMNSRNPQAAAANPQMQSMQKFFPILFGVIYLRVPAGAAIYMVVSSAMRIGTQEFMFRTGMVTAPAQEREIGGSPKAKPASGGAAPKAKPKPNPVTDGSALAKELDAGSTEGADGTPRTNGKTGSTNGKTPSNGTAPAKRPAAAKNAAKRTAQPEPEPVAKEHPRSRSKRTRKAR
jgi:membrane protein insertase Oxa1/YidC/SpoIIIJ